MSKKEPSYAEESYLLRKHFGKIDIGLRTIMNKAEELGMSPVATSIATSTEMLRFIDEKAK